MKLQRYAKKNQHRQCRSFFEFCEKKQGRNLPKSLTGRAISYALNQRVTLEAFLKNPKIELTNNSAERAIKPFVIGRKNWLFCNSEAGAQASSIIYSIIETAKANNINPYDWLEQIFISIQQGVDTIKSLLCILYFYTYSPLESLRWAIVILVFCQGVPYFTLTFI